jgi:hypothetical protein
MTAIVQRLGRASEAHLSGFLEYEVENPPETYGLVQYQMPSL